MKKLEIEQYKELLIVCSTELHQERLEACIKYGSQGKAAEALGVDRKRINETIALLKERYKNYIPEGHVVTGVSTCKTLPNGDRQWLKTNLAQEKQKSNLKKALLDTFKKYKGASIVHPEPQHAEEDLMVFIPIGDAHIGMLAWHEEAGVDFDLSISEELMCNAMDRLIESAPNAHTCFIADMGDFLHRNDNKNATPASGNVLDVDGRAIKMMRVAVKILIHSIDLALQKFPKVILRNVCGNHSPEGEQMLALALQLYYHNNDRVTVETSPNKFYYYQWGQILIGLTHGDKVKHGELPMIMAADVPKMWGDTVFHYFYIGHVHHQSTKEYQGCSVESFNTLTPNDAWHHGSGYRARKNIKLLVMHKKYGEIERITKDVSMIMGEN